jgi:hypothetical protein
MHVALIGGLGTGKTETAKKLCELVEDSEYMYMSRFAVRIPMALQRMSHPNLLTYSRDEYINTILSNIDAPEIKALRLEMDAFGAQVFKKYGANVAGEIALAAISNDKIGIFDGVATVANVAFMADKGVYIVGHECTFETQVKRVLGRKRDIDPKERSAVEKQIRDTQAFFETERCMTLTHIVYDTDKMNTIELACAIAPVAMLGRK